jgi:hypothetical protein
MIRPIRHRARAADRVRCPGRLIFLTCCRRAVLIFSLQLYCGVAFADSSYLCLPSQAVGYAFNKASHQWDVAHFKLDKKYLMKKTADGWHWTEFGSTFASRMCREVGFVECNTSDEQEVMFDPKTLRYQIYYRYGFIGGAWEADGKSEDQSEDTPYIEIGTCAPT